MKRGHLIQITWLPRHKGGAANAGKTRTTILLDDVYLMMARSHHRSNKFRIHVAEGLIQIDVRTGDERRPD